MHLHQPDWKSGVGAVDGGVDAGDHADRTDVADGRLTWERDHIFYL